VSPVDRFTTIVLSAFAGSLGIMAGVLLHMATQPEPFVSHVRTQEGMLCLEAPRSAVERDDIGPVTVDKAELVIEKQQRRAYVMRLARLASDRDLDDDSRAALDAEAAAWMQWMEKDKS
jgi:hypothetical protein